MSSCYFAVAGQCNAAAAAVHYNGGERFKGRLLLHSPALPSFHNPLQIWSIALFGLFCVHAVSYFMLHHAARDTRERERDGELDAHAANKVNTRDVNWLREDRGAKLPTWGKKKPGALPQTSHVCVELPGHVQGLKISSPCKAPHPESMLFIHLCRLACQNVSLMNIPEWAGIRCKTDGKRWPGVGEGKRCCKLASYG